MHKLQIEEGREKAEAGGWVRRAVTLAALAALAGCDPSGCNVPTPTAELRFARDGAVINTQPTIAGRTVSAVALSPVPTVPLLGGLSVDFRGEGYSLAPVDNQGLQGPQIEAHLFVADLADTTAYLRGIYAAGDGGAWDARTSVSSLGGDVILPYPPNPAWDLRRPYALPSPVTPELFWGGAPPGAPASDPTGNGSVKSVRFYRAGLCGFEQPFTTRANDGLFDTISDEFFLGFSSNKEVQTGSAVRNYSRVTTLLDEGLSVDGPRGGFFLYFWYDATASRFPVSIHFTANYEYELGLDDGRLAVEPRRNDLLVKPQGSFRDLRDTLEITLPSELRRQFEERQRQVIADCNPGGGTQNAQLVLSLAAASGGKRLGLSDSDQGRLVTAITQPSNWGCDVAERAYFILRAKRINIYPDAVELVWFDSINVDDPMYALYAAAVSQDSAQSLCSRPRTTVGNEGGPRTAGRPIVTVAR